MKVLISNLYECAVLDIIIYKTSPQKVYLITVKDEKMTGATIKRLKKDLKHIEFDVVYVDEFDVIGITEKIHKIINVERGNTIVVNVTEGRKTMSFAGVFAASLNKDEVEGAYYLRQDNHEFIQLPLIDFTLSNTKMKVLQELDRGNKKVIDITAKVKVNRSLIYASIKDLIKKKYITPEWEVTDSGKICLIGADTVNGVGTK